MHCTNPFHKFPTRSEWILLGREKIHKKYPRGYIEVPCGRCLGCRIAHARMWTVRLMCELKYWKEAGFITLTYNDENLPEFASLIKSDLQLFYKRFRKELSNEKRIMEIGKGFEESESSISCMESKVKYYSCGEYGEKGRPHYHVILFGYGLASAFIDGELRKVKNGFVVQSGPLCKCWPKGRVHIGEVTYDSCRYVAQYIDSKFSGDLASKVYHKKFKTVPFQLSSQGLGFNYAFENFDLFNKDLTIKVRNHDVGIPRYFKKKLPFDQDRLDDFAAHLFYNKLNDYYKLGLRNWSEIDEYMRDVRKQKALNLRRKHEISISEKRLNNKFI